MRAKFLAALRALCVLAAWRCTAVSAEITFEDIMREGAACLQMAVYIPRLQTLTGSFQSHLRVNVLTIYVH